MQEALEQRAQRHGTVNRVIEIPWLPRSQSEIVRAYAEALTPQTRYILVSHMIYLTGQVLPIREICDMAHARGVEEGAGPARGPFGRPRALADHAGTAGAWGPVLNGTHRQPLIRHLWPLLQRV